MNNISNLSNPITCFIKADDAEQVRFTVKQLTTSPLINAIYLLGTNSDFPTIEGCEFIPIDSLTSTQTLQKNCDTCQF